MTGVDITAADDATDVEKESAGPRVGDRSEPENPDVKLPTRVRVGVEGGSGTKLALPPPPPPPPFCEKAWEEPLMPEKLLLEEGLGEPCRFSGASATPTA